MKTMLYPLHFAVIERFQQEDWLPTIWTLKPMQSANVCIRQLATFYAHFCMLSRHKMLLTPMLLCILVWPWQCMLREQRYIDRYECRQEFWFFNATCFSIFLWLVILLLFESPSFQSAMTDPSHGEGECCIRPSFMTQFMTQLTTSRIWRRKIMESECLNRCSDIVWVPEKYHDHGV